MERFDGTPEEKKAVMGLLAEMGYAVEGGGIPQLQKDVQELSPEAFMEAIPKGTDFRTRANLSRFVKDLMLGETDPPPVGLSDPVDTIAEKDERFHIILHNILKADENERKLTIRVIHLSRFVDYTLQSRHHCEVIPPRGLVSSADLRNVRECQLSSSILSERSIGGQRFHAPFSQLHVSQHGGVCCHLEASTCTCTAHSLCVPIVSLGTFSFCSYKTQP